MLTWEEEVEAAALRKQGWSISAIARHLGRDRKTIRAYLTGAREPGTRKRATPDPFAPFIPYITTRLQEDPPRLPTRPARKSSGTGWSCRKSPGAAMPIY
jgi:transposase